MVSFGKMRTVLLEARKRTSNAVNRRFERVGITRDRLAHQTRAQIRGPKTKILAKNGGGGSFDVVLVLPTERVTGGDPTVAKVCDSTMSATENVCGGI
jgi:hypothetical protein